MPQAALLQEASCTGATEFSGYVKTLPSIRPTEKLVFSQVLVPPLVQEYAAVKKEWMKQKLWKQEDFIEVHGESCSDETKTKIVEAVHTFLEMRMDAHIKELKRKNDHNWKRLLVESFETTLSDPKVSSNVEMYVVPDSDPVEALRGQRGLKTVAKSDMFVIGVFRSRVMLELPTFLEQERINCPPGFHKSPYWWVLEMDRYAVDGSSYCPYWMSQAHAAPKKKKCSTAKLSKWTEGYSMIYSAFGYGNETVLCNDPHLTPWTDLDDTEVNQQAMEKINTLVKECRIGPWVFPIQVTSDFLPKGLPLFPSEASEVYFMYIRHSNLCLFLHTHANLFSKVHGLSSLALSQPQSGPVGSLPVPCVGYKCQYIWFTGTPLLYYYGREYWVSLRASQAMARLTDEREANLRCKQEQTQRENEALRQQQEQLWQENQTLRSCLQTLHSQHTGAALQLVQASLDTGRAIAALSSPDTSPQLTVQFETPKRDIRQRNLSDTTPHGANMPADATAGLAATPYLGAIDTDRPQPSSLKSDDTATAVKQPDAATALIGTRAGDSTVGQLQAALGQLATNAPMAVSAPALPAVGCEVHSLRQSYGSLLPPMTILEANLHGMDQQQQQQLPEDSISHQFEPQHAQHDHAAGPLDAHDFTPTTDNPEQLEAAAQHPFQMLPVSQRQESWHSMHSVRSGAAQAGRNPSAIKHLWGAVPRQQQESTWQAALTLEGKRAAALERGNPGAAIPPRTEHLSGTEGGHRLVSPQAKAPTGIRLRLSAAKRSGGKGQQPKPQKKRKLSETAATAGADSGSQPAAAGAAGAEAAAAADRAGHLWDTGPILWGGGKQKIKHARLGSADGPYGLPDQARRAPQQTPFGPATAGADCPAAAVITAATTTATTTAAAAAGAPGAQCDKTRLRQEQLPCGVSSAHDTVPAADLRQEAVGAMADCGAANGDEHGGASDDGSEEFGEQVAELRELASAAQQHRPACPFVVVNGAQVICRHGQSLGQRCIVAPQDDLTHLHLFAKDIQQACGGKWSHAAGHKQLLSLLQKAEAMVGPQLGQASIANALQAVETFSWHHPRSIRRYTVAAHGIKALLLPGVLPSARRSRLRCFTADMWSLGRPSAASSSPTAAQTSPRADAHSPPAHPPCSPTAAALPAGAPIAGPSSGSPSAEAAAEGTGTEDAADSMHDDPIRQQAQTQGTTSDNSSSSSDSNDGSSSSSEDEQLGRSSSPVNSSVDREADGAVPDVEAGAANPVAVLNTPETSFAVADSRQINVSPPSATSVMVQRNLIAAAGRAGQYYLSAEDALKACGRRYTSNLIHEVQQLLSHEAAAEVVSQAEAQVASTSGRDAGSHACLVGQAEQWTQHTTKAHMLAQVYCSGYSKAVVVLGGLGVQALLKSPAVTEEARLRLQHFLADLEIFEGQITHPVGSQQDSGLRAVRADAGSPEEVEVSIERESNSRAKSLDQAGAEQSSPAPGSSPAASSPQAASTLENQATIQAEGNAGCPEGLSPRACSSRSESQHRPRCKAAPLGGALQTACKGDSHSPAAPEDVPALSAAHAAPALAASSHAALAAAQKPLPVCHPSASQEKVLPPADALHEPCQQTVSASTAAGRLEAHVPSAVAQAHTDTRDANVETVHMRRDSTVCMSGSLSNFCEAPFGDNRHGLMMGRRKRARKSTRSEHEPAGSVQQSNALLLQSANNEPNTSSAALSIGGQDVATYDACSNKTCASDEVIDLTGPGDL